MPYRYRNCFVYNLGERGSGSKPHGQIQDFYKLRDQCLAEGKLFEDPEFPCADSSILCNEDSKQSYEWKRPVEIINNPKLCIEGASRFDIQQGSLGDCWFISAMANLTLNTSLFTQVVPDDQGFDNKYAGIFHFRFWQCGRWIDVVVDDRLPTEDNSLVFLHSSTANEFWSALLEKAYAKLNGSYGSLDGGLTCDAMEDFTGGVKEFYNLNDAPSNLHQIMIKAYERSSLMCCVINNRDGMMRKSFGLVEGHAYSITRVMCADMTTNNKSVKIPLVRIRNPWGEETEWKGAWSDKSEEWCKISEERKQEIGLTFNYDGEFWMCYEDFCKYFDYIEICNLSPDSLTEEISDCEKRHWEMSMFDGEWVKGVTAGGNVDYTDTFWHNPQYRITLIDPDENDDKSECTAIIALMQKHHRKLRENNCCIGFCVYHLEEPDSLPKPLDSSFFENRTAVQTFESPDSYIREISYRLKLPPGVYCVVPYTHEADDEAQFLLRVFSENKNNMVENYEKVDFRDLDNNVDSVSTLSKMEEENVEDIFMRIAGDDLEVSWMELKEILDNICDTNSGGFSKDVCRSMIAMMDADKTGKLGLNEFKQLWLYVKQWKAVFNTYEKGKSGSLSVCDLREALSSAGYLLNNNILNSVARRFGSKDGLILLDDFILCAIKLKAMINIFHERDPGNTDTATFTIEEWVETTLCS